MANQRLYLQYKDIRICLAKRHSTEWVNANGLELLDNLLEKVQNGMDADEAETIKLFYEHDRWASFDPPFEFIEDSSHLPKITRLPTQQSQ